MGYMKRLVVAAAIGAFGALAGAAKAEPVDASTVTCKDVLQTAQGAEADQARTGVMIWWVLGYAASDANGTVMDFDNLEKGMGQIEEYCNKNPQFGLLNAAQKFGNTDKTARLTSPTIFSCFFILDGSSSSSMSSSGKRRSKWRSVTPERIKPSTPLIRSVKNWIRTNGSRIDQSDTRRSDFSCSFLI